jgi:Na+-driven multidrug efflux pump
MDPVRRQRILGLALPIIGGMVSQNLLNIVDTAMVGFLGDSALAAVGLGGFVSSQPPRARKAKAGSIAP